MNNFIDYFYNMMVNDIYNQGEYYEFVYTKYIYRLCIYDGDIDINHLVYVNRHMLNHTLMGEIILNKDGNPLSIYNGNSYVLIKLHAFDNKKISLSDISCLTSSLKVNKICGNWGILWSKKIDYLEDLITENEKKYPIIANSFSYFVGWAENAISYFNNINPVNNHSAYINHKIIRFQDNCDILYNPLNIIFDYKVRDVAEYIKNAFFQNNERIFDELKEYLHNNNLSTSDVKLLISRILYPSFYFELYDEILIDGKSEKIIIPIIKMMPKYEKYISVIIAFFKEQYDIDSLLWLIRN